MSCMECEIHLSTVIVFCCLGNFILIINYQEKQKEKKKCQVTQEHL